MYPLPANSHHAISQTNEGGSIADTGTKLDKVCNAVREELVKCGEDRYFLSIITTHVKMTHPQVETVLRMIQKLKGKGSALSLVGFIIRM